MGSGAEIPPCSRPFDKLGGAVGASRAAVDAGMVPEQATGRPDRGKWSRRNSTLPWVLVARSSICQVWKRTEDDRGHQQGRRGADLPGRGSWLVADLFEAVLSSTQLPMIDQHCSVPVQFVNRGSQLESPRRFLADNDRLLPSSRAFSTSRSA